jgi:hypothetical protein
MQYPTGIVVADVFMNNYRLLCVFNWALQLDKLAVLQN